MANVISRKSTHAGKLERWLGKDQTEQISKAMSSWYGPPILIGGIPSVSGVYCQGGGDFSGRIDGGVFGSLAERCLERLNRAATKVASRHRMHSFSSLSDLISEATLGGKRNDFFFSKAGTTAVVGGTNSFWRVGPQPAAASAASNAPGGNVPTDATTGAFPFVNPTSPDTQHFVRSEILSSVAPRSILMYDRIFEVNKTMSSTATETVTGTPTRYQNTTDGTADSAAGNFLGIEVQAALGATAHNWTVCTYTDQNGNASTLPSVTGNSAAIINRLDFPLNQWFAPLASGDFGVRALTQMQCSASVTGTVAFFIGHPIAWLPCVVTNMVTIIDGINTAFNLTRIFDDAALAFLEVNTAVTTAATITGQVSTVQG